MLCGRMDNTREKPPAQTRCAWCGAFDSLDKDHVIPRCIGGTRDLFVWACRKCQTAIGRAETELIKRSPASIYRFDVGPGPRRRTRSASGLVLPSRVLRKTGPGCGYALIGMRALREIFELPAIEFSLEKRHARKRGAAPEVIDDLLRRLLAVVEGPPADDGLLGEIDVEFLRDWEDEVRQDPEFWPRAYISATNRLTLLARDPRKAEALLHALVYLARKGALSDHRDWSSHTIPAGVGYRVALAWKTECELLIPTM